jgi:hypothetical protein
MNAAEIARWRDPALMPGIAREMLDAGTELDGRALRRRDAPATGGFGMRLAAAPPRKAMNSRRLIVFQPSIAPYHIIGKLCVHHSILAHPTSAMGQRRRSQRRTHYHRRTTVSRPFGCASTEFFRTTGGHLARSIKSASPCDFVL